jgi:hypothetical protein
MNRRCNRAKESSSRECSRGSTQAAIAAKHECAPQSHISRERHQSGGRHRLSRCSESPIKTRSSGSFGTASPGDSSPGATQASPDPVSVVARNPMLAPSPAAAVSRSASRRRNASPLNVSMDDEEGRLSTSTSDASASLMEASASLTQSAPERAAEHVAASPVVQRRRDAPPCNSPTLAGSAGPGSTQNVSLLLRLVDSLQAEKAALDERLRHVLADNGSLQEDNARLRAANLEKDRQLALLLGTHARGSVGGCSSCLSGFSASP